MVYNYIMKEKIMKKFFITIIIVALILAGLIFDYLVLNSDMSDAWKIYILTR